LTSFNFRTIQITDLLIFIAGDVNAHPSLLHEAADKGFIAGMNVVFDACQNDELLTYTQAMSYAAIDDQLKPSLFRRMISSVPSIRSMMPLSARFIGIDPAMATASFMMTIVDAGGFAGVFTDCQGNF